MPANAKVNLPSEARSHAVQLNNSELPKNEIDIIEWLILEELEDAIKYSEVLTQEYHQSMEKVYSQEDCREIFGFLWGGYNNILPDHIY